MLANSEEKNDVQNRTIRKIAIICAMTGEAKGLRETLNLKESQTHSAQMPSFLVSENQERTIFLVSNGKDATYKCDRVGTQWATLCAYLTIQTIRPDIIINAGTCGGVVPKYCFDDMNDFDESTHPEVDIADVFIGERVIYSDRRVALPAYQGWDCGNYELCGALYLAKKINNIKIAKCLSSSNAFDYTKEDQMLFKKHGVVCKDMECAAIAEICTHYECKLIALKGVTDLVQHHDAKDFLKNFQKTVAAVTKVTLDVVKEIQGKELSALDI